MDQKTALLSLAFVLSSVTLTLPGYARAQGDPSKSINITIGGSASYSVTGPEYSIVQSGRAQKVDDWMGRDGLSMLHPFAGPNAENLPLDHYARTLQQVGRSRYNVDIPLEVLRRDILVNRLFYEADPRARREHLHKASQSLSFDEKILVTAEVGGFLLENYDHARAQAGSKAKGAVGFDQLFDSRRSGVPAGVCRDIAVAQAQMLNALGVNQVFVVAYATVGASHATVVIQDPNDRSQSIKINYFAVTTTEDGAGGLTHLRQDHSLPEAGIAYHVFDSNGRALGSFPTEVGSFLEEAIAGDLRALDPMLYSQNSMLQLKSEGDRGGVYAAGGYTHSGDEVLTAGAKLNTISEYNNGYVGIAIASVSHQTSWVRNHQSQMLYVTAVQKLTLPQAKFEAFQGRLVIQPYIPVSVQAMVGRSRYDGRNGGQKKGTIADINARTGIGVQADYTSPSGQYKATGHVQMDANINFRDIRDMGTVGPNYERTHIDLTLSRKVDKNSDVYSRSGAVVRSSQLGTQVYQEFGYRNQSDERSYQAYAGVQGGVNKKAPAFVPGQEREVYVGAAVADDRRSGEVAIHCPIKGLKNCGVRAGGNYSLPVNWDRRLLGEI